MVCQGLRSNCKKCGKHWSKYDPERHSAKVCPVCGESRACGKQAVRGYRFCELHGGPNPKNNFYGLGVGLTTGASSGFPLTRLAAKYQEMQKNGALLTNRKSIDVVRKRLEELLERVDARDMGERVAALHDLWQKHKEYDAHGEDLKLLETRQALDEEFEKVYHDYRSWEQIMDVIDLDRKLVESEVKVAKDMHAIMTAEEAFEMIAQIFGIILRLEDDPIKLKAYQYELTRLVGDRSVVEVEAGDGDDLA